MYITEVLIALHRNHLMWGAWDYLYSGLDLNQSLGSVCCSVNVKFGETSAGGSVSLVAGVGR